MKYTLGSRAQTALSNSLGKLNHTFRSSLSSFSATKFSGVIQNHSSWSNAETRLWMVVLMVGVVLLHGNQIALAYALGDVKKSEGWTISTKSAFLASFYCGNSLTPLLSYYMSERHGGERVQWACALVWSLILPLTALLLYHSKIMILYPLQLVRGMAQGFHAPALFSIVSMRCAEESWPLLLSLLLSVAPLGPGLVGSVVSSNATHLDPSHPDSTYIDSTHQTSPGRWAYDMGLLLFIAIPGVGVAWAVFVRYLLARSTNLHKTHYNLSETKDLIKSGKSSGLHIGPALSEERIGKREKHKLEMHSRGTRSSSPWRKMLRNPSIVVLLASHFSVNLFFQACMTWLPSLWSSAHSDYVVLWNVAPWVAMAIGSLGAAGVSQWIGGHKTESGPTGRMFVFTSLGGLSVFLVTMAAAGPTHSMMHFVGTVCSSLFYGVWLSRWPLSMLLLAPPELTGTLFATMEIVKSISGIVSVYMIGVTMATGGSPRLALGMMAMVDTVALLLCLIFGTPKKPRL